MRKLFLLPLVAAAALVSQAWGAVCTSPGGGTFCQFSTGCYEMSSGYSSTTTCCGSEDADCKKAHSTWPACTCGDVIDNCITNGSVYKGVTGLNSGNGYGAGVICKDNDGTWTKEGNNPDFDGGWCKWKTGCEAIKDEADLENCKENGYHYDDDKCTVWSGDGNNPAEEWGYCKWPTGCEDNKTEAGYENCKKNGSVFEDAECKVWAGEGIDPDATQLGCCKWSTGTGCYPIMSGKNADGKDGETLVGNCKGGTNVFWAGAEVVCGGEEGICPNSTPTWPVSSSSSDTPSSSSAASSSSSVEVSSSSSAGSSSSSVEVSSSSSASTSSSSSEAPSSSSAGSSSSSVEVSSSSSAGSSSSSVEVSSSSSNGSSSSSSSSEGSSSSASGNSSSSSESSTRIASNSSLVNSHSPTYYSLKGEPLGNVKPQKAGVYIVKQQGSPIKKIVVR